MRLLPLLAAIVLCLSACNNTDKENAFLESAIKARNQVPGGTFVSYTINNKKVVEGITTAYYTANVTQEGKSISLPDSIQYTHTGDDIYFEYK